MEKEVFKLIYENNYINLIELLEKDKLLNLNIKDSHNIYFIEYILHTHNIKLIEYIMTKKINLDILDINGYFLLYPIIKYNNITLLNIIIKYDKNKIGIDILNKQDHLGNTGIMYSIIFNNENIFNILLESNIDPYITNNEHFNSFFLCLKYNRNIFLQKLLKRYINPDIRNNKNENLLQESINYSNYSMTEYLLDNFNININNKSSDYGITALHILTINNNFSLIKKIIYLGGNITISDYFGNNLLHYSLSESNIDLLKYYLNFNVINLNFSNLNGNTPLHLYLILLYNKKITFDDQVIYNMIKKTDLNIQNNDGNTILHLLIINNLFDKFQEYLKNKELNIFIKNYDNMTPYNYYKNLNNNLDNFIKIIIDSYYNTIVNNKKFILKWEIDCNKILNDKIDKTILKENMTKEKCIDKIKNEIIIKKRSIPKVKDINFNFDLGIVLNDCFFSGFPIDTLFGILWLKENVKNIHLILDHTLVSNVEISKFYKSIGKNFQFYTDFGNIMIYWCYQQIYFPEYFNIKIKNVISNIKSGFIIIPIGIEVSMGAHTNILLWDIKKKEIERFEPNGKYPPISLKYNPKLLDKILEEKFKSFDENIVYIPAKKYLPIVSFSILENLENDNCKMIGDPNGFCTVWCIWYCYQRISNNNIPRTTLVNELISEFKVQGKNFKTVIRNFSKNISNFRDKYLKKVNLDINKWINSNYSKETLYKLEKYITELL